MAEQELLTVDDVCAWLRVTKSWVYDEIEASRLPSIRLGRRHVRFSREDLLAFLQEKRSPSVSS